MDTRHTQPIQSVPLDDTQDEVSLERIFTTLWSYRKVIEAGIAIALGVYVVLALAGFMLLPRERLASIGFRLVFDGVDEARYPNGLKFSTSEIISTPVLAEVYENDKLVRYINSFEKFKNSIFIQDANRDLEMLDLEYSGRLADQKLAPVDRARIETEYRDKRKSLTAPYYMLTLRRNEWITQMPPAMAEKVLRDTLSTWAQQADTRKGALKYNIRLYTRATVPLDLVEHEDYLIAADVLRIKTLAMQDSVDQIQQLPGAQMLRVGPTNLTLGEIHAELNDTMRFRLQPLIATITESGATTDPKRLRVYIENQLAQAIARQAEVQRRADSLERSLALYLGQRRLTTEAVSAAQPVRPAPGEQTAPLVQVSESFLERVMDLTRENTDVKYRQDLADRLVRESLNAASVGRDIPFYQELLRRVPAGGSSSAESASIRAATKSVYEALAKTIDQVNTFYADLSSQNLTSPTGLYTPTDPFFDVSQRSLSVPSIIMYGTLTFLLSLFLVPLGCLAHHATFGRRRRASNP